MDYVIPNKKSQTIPIDVLHIMLNSIKNGESTVEDCIRLQAEYEDCTKYLFTFDMSPRPFGEGWAESYIVNLSNKFKNPRDADDMYDGEYDIWMDDIKIEIKASRVVDKNKPKIPMGMKSLPKSSDGIFGMNFQQLKPKCCDIFIWLAVFRDDITIWVLSSDDVINNKYYGNKQHRNSTDEGQLLITNKNIREFDQFKVTNTDELIEIIKYKFNE